MSNVLFRGKICNENGNVTIEVDICIEQTPNTYSEIKDLPAESTSTAVTKIAQICESPQVKPEKITQEKLLRQRLEKNSAKQSACRLRQKDVRNNGNLSKIQRTRVIQMRMYLKTLNLLFILQIFVRILQRQL